MLIQRIIYDNSCNYFNEKNNTSAQADSLFDLMKDYIQIIEEEIFEFYKNSQSDKK